MESMVIVAWMSPDEVPWYVRSWQMVPAMRTTQRIRMYIGPELGVKPWREQTKIESRAAGMYTMSSTTEI